MIKRALSSVPVIVVLYVLTGCENSLIDRSLIFATHTTAGLEVAVGGPAETAVSPVKLIIGYKRSEGVLNPVYDRMGISTSGTDANGLGDRYRKEAYSVVAKLVGEAEASAGSQAEGAMGVAQWFATGRAANIIARNDGIAAAVTGSSEIAKATAGAALRAARDERSKLIAFTLLNPIYKELDRLADEGHLQARKLADKMDAIKPDQLQYDFPWYIYYSDIGNLTDTQALPDMSEKPFMAIHNYYSSLDDSIKQLTNAVTDQGLSQYNGETITNVTEKRRELYNELEKLKDKKRALDQHILQNQEIIHAAVDYLYR